MTSSQDEREKLAAAASPADLHFHQVSRAIRRELWDQHAETIDVANGVKLYATAHVELDVDKIARVAIAACRTPLPLALPIPPGASGEGR